MRQDDALGPASESFQSTSPDDQKSNIASLAMRIAANPVISSRPSFIGLWSGSVHGAGKITSSIAGSIRVLFFCWRAKTFVCVAVQIAGSEAG